MDETYNKWIKQSKNKLGGENSTLSRIDKTTGKHFYISYNENPPAGDGEETAFKICDIDTFYVLNGDFRKHYEVCMTIDECMKVYNDNISCRSYWSTDYMDEEITRESLSNHLDHITRFMSYLKSKN